MPLLLQVLQKIENKFVEPQTNIDILTYIKFLEATVVIIKDYDYINTIGIYIIKFIEQSINQKNYMQSYDQEVSYIIFIIFLSINNQHYKIFENVQFNILI